MDITKFNLLQNYNIFSEIDFDILKVSLLEFEQTDQMQKDKNNFCCCNFNLEPEALKKLKLL